MTAEAVAWVYRHSDTHGPTFAVHLAVADAVTDLHDWRFWAPAAEIAKKARVNRNTAGEALRRLTDEGYLEEVQAPNGRAGVYRFLFPEGRRVVYQTRGRGAGNPAGGPAGIPARRGAGIPATPAGIPAPLPYIETQVTKTLSEGEAVPAGPPTPADAVRHYVDLQKARGVTPPQHLRSGIGQQAKRLMAEGVEWSVLKTAVRWCAEENKLPGALPGLVMDVQAHRAERKTNGQKT